MKILDYTDCTIRQNLDILKLRNSDDIRGQMTNTQIISTEEHFRFVTSLASDNDRKYFAVYDDNMLLATFNLTRHTDNEWERGVFASPIIQGRGITPLIEQMMLPLFKQFGCDTLYAKVYNSNSRSKHYHEKVGYKAFDNDEQYTYYRLHI